MAVIIRFLGEAFLKGALVVALVSAGLPAAADELVVGVLRDQDGGVIAGARIQAVDGSGTVIGHDRSAGDGTFALTSTVRPVGLDVQADDSDPVHVVVPPDGDVVAILRRHRAADAVPSVADVAALPAGGFGELSSVVPHRVALYPHFLSDRYLARGYGVETVERLPFYRRADGGSAASLLPAHAVGALDVRGPLDAPWYGDRAGGGIVDARLFDREDQVRATDRDAVLAFGHDPSVVTAESWDPDGVRRLAAARASGPLGPASATLVALAGDAPDAYYAGIGADVRAALRRIDVEGRLGFTRDTDVRTADTGSVSDVELDASGRGANAVPVQLRWREERAEFDGREVAHRDAALVLGTTRGNVARVTSALAFTYGDERAYDGTTRRSEVALLPSIAFDAPLGGRWAFHAGTGTSTLGTPGWALARATLGEAGVRYSDHRRLRGELLAYAERDEAPRAVLRGMAASIGWEVAPRLSLRAWSMRDGDSVDAFVPIYPGGPAPRTEVRRPIRRDLVWLTWDAPTRVDLLLRAGALEGNVQIPLSARFALTAGSSRRAQGTRAFALGLVVR